MPCSVFQKVQFLLALQQMGAKVDGEKQKVLLDLFLGGRGIVHASPGRPLLTLPPLLLSCVLPRFKVMWCYRWSEANYPMQSIESVLPPIDDPSLRLHFITRFSPFMLKKFQGKRENESDRVS